ncbi:hypothetical protein KCP75_09065 [Salmonella enterica subsp. enterica]|nr:hypothetical protein KCP75_09065 [Salmonella enterica subsp. enterica]
MLRWPVEEAGRRPITRQVNDKFIGTNLNNRRASPAGDMDIPDSSISSTSVR